MKRRRPIVWILIVMGILLAIGMSEPNCCQPGGFDEEGERQY